MNINDINSSDSGNSLNSLESEEQHILTTGDKENKYLITNNLTDNNCLDTKCNKINDFSHENNKQIPSQKLKLLKVKAYYKSLLTDLKKFIKKINFQSKDGELSYDATGLSKQTIDKSKNYNIEDTRKNLYKNIKNIKKDLYYVSEQFNEKILIFDGENILKSYKYQQLIKLHLSNDQYNNYFGYWHHGSSDGVIQPMTSLNLSIDDKLYLMEPIVKNYFNFFNCIIILSGKKSIDSNPQISYINFNKSIVIPIIYDKEDIREQDDHLLLYIYYHLSKIKNCSIISGDKFKWFSHDDYYLKNLRLEYNFDEKKINIDVCDAYTNDTFVYNKHKYQLGYYYFPFVKNIFQICENTFEKLTGDIVKDNIIMEQYQLHIVQLTNDRDYDSIINFIIGLFLILIDSNSNYLQNILLIKKYSELVTFFISKIIHSYNVYFEELEFILKRISSISKKVFDKIEKYDSDTLNKIIFESNDNLSSLSSLSSLPSFISASSPTMYTYDRKELTLRTTNPIRTTWINSKPNSKLETESNSELIFKPCSKQNEEFIKNVDTYISVTEIYLILKSMSFLLSNNLPIIKLAKLFSRIMKIYDLIDESIHKIRKISNTSTEFNKMFLSIFSHHIFMKKNGFCKKDY
jgi:hypothetical protein